MFLDAFTYFFDNISIIEPDIGTHVFGPSNPDMSRLCKL